MSNINLDELYEKENEILMNREKIYTKILLRVHKKIKHISRTKVQEKYCFFVIPEFLLGTPKYDVSLCTAYVIEKLQNNGFNIKYTYPNLLFISWNHFINKEKRKLIKKLYGVSIDGFGNKKNEQSKLNSVNNKLIKKKEDYKDIKSYKPSGKLVYNINLFDDIENSIKKT